jgi:hypothetical protein
MIAAAAAPIWRELPEPATVKPVQPLPPATPKAKPALQPYAFQSASIQAGLANVRGNRVASAALDTQGQQPSAGRGEPEATATSSNESPVIVADSVSGRYGL